MRPKALLGPRAQVVDGWVQGADEGRGKLR